MSGAPEKPGKIIVDEDWKSKAQAEKEAIKQQAEESAGPSPDSVSKGTGKATRSSGPHEFPPADFMGLVQLLVGQAMMAMGAIPHPISGKSEPNRNLARHFIEMLDILSEKTKGNLTPGESAALEAVLRDLRFGFVELESGQQA